MTSTADILNAAHSELLESLYNDYLANPASVSGEWAALFGQVQTNQLEATIAVKATPAGVGQQAPPQVLANGAVQRVTAPPSETSAGGDSPNGHGASSAGSAGGAVCDTGRDSPLMVTGVYALVQSYRELGHLEADINPLAKPARDHPLLKLSEFGLGPSDQDRVVGRASFTGQTDGRLVSLIEALRETYCGPLGVEFMHITDRERRLWLAQRMEQSRNRPGLSAQQKRQLLRGLAEAEDFERYLDVKFKGKKRFSLEGAETLIPMLDNLITGGAAAGVEEVVIGMAHRGRLNVLANTLRKPLDRMFAEIKDAIKQVEGDGDVKYHLGYSYDRELDGQRRVHLSLCYNPSHLELVNPVAEGMVRAKQQLLGDRQGRRVMPLLIHGDAAFVGQGIVMETLTLCQLEHYRTGGTVHVIIDNQVGFTAEAAECRFTRYPTDMMKIVEAPIFHVNADAPEAAALAVELAVAYRQEFGSDVMIHLLGYRRHGHNETDEPRFTQPEMYARIDKHPSVRTQYQQRLIAEGVLDEAGAEAMRSEIRAVFDAALEAVKAEGEKPAEAVSVTTNAMASPGVGVSRGSTTATPGTGVPATLTGGGSSRAAGLPTFGGVWKGLSRAPGELRDWTAHTAVAAETLLRITEAATRLPGDFTAHPTLRRLYEARRRSVVEGRGINWGTGEMLAIGSLLLEGTAVRLAGQDSERGTFSHRQAVLHDINSPRTLNTLAELAPGKFTVLNSMLSELAVMGFEYGFSSADPWTLVMWEAQFGDFVNGAQAMIDQYIVAAESKWQRHNGLVLLLPHGYEGQGPEHSNARPERFLQLAAENNIQLCWPTTPAQYFHVLRRQMHRKFRKPLILMTPKSLLRDEKAASTLDEFTTAPGFANVLDDPAFVAGRLRREAARRLIFCSGKVYYTLLAEREAQPGKFDHIALVRIEQLYPFPAEEVRAVAAAYPNLSEVFWCQEEPCNMGGWTFVRGRLTENLPPHLAPVYRGRRNAASPATGSYHQHQIEERNLVADALGGSPSVAAMSAVPVMAVPTPAGVSASPTGVLSARQ